MIACKHSCVFEGKVLPRESGRKSACMHACMRTLGGHLGQTESERGPSRLSEQWFKDILAHSAQMLGTDD